MSDDSCEPFEAEYLRPPQCVCDPDPRTLHLANFNEKTKEIRPTTIADQYNAVAAFLLNSTAPEAVRIHFETAKNLYLYAWFVFRFYPIAEQQALASLEFALRERMKDHPRGEGRGLRALLRHAIDAEILCNTGFRARERWAIDRARKRYSLEKLLEMERLGMQEMVIDESEAQVSEDDLNCDWLGAFLDSIPKVRNEYAHGSDILHHSVLDTFDVVAEIINQLFPEKSSS